MIHLAALPGTPASSLSVGRIVDQARREARVLTEGGIDALLIENMHDTPYLRGEVGPEIVAAMTAAAGAVRSETDLPCGVQVLAGANEAALAVALAAGLDFIRAEGFVFAHVADEGIIESCAGRLLRLRKSWGAEKVKVFADIKKKHGSHAITSDVDIVETAHAAEFFRADGVVVTGSATGKAVDVAELVEVARSTELPVLVGSGATLENLDALFAHASALIVGSHFKRDGHWAGEIDAGRVAAFVHAVSERRAAA